MRNIKIDHFEIIIVDNDSQDGSETILKQAFPLIRYFEMRYNSGFARANNKGISVASFDTILLLNADCIIEENAITRCYQELTNSSYLASGIQLLNFNRTFQISGSYVIKGGLNYLLPLPYLGSAIKLLAKIIKVRKPSIKRAIQFQEVDWINGAFLMVKYDAVKLAGMMDEDFFLYMEEIEWCSRLRKHGRLCIYGNIHSVHLQGMTAKDHFKSADNGYQNLFNKMGKQLMLSIWVRQRKQYGLWWFLFLFLVYAIEIPVFLLGICVSKLLFRNTYSFQDFAGYTSNFFFNTSFIKHLFTNKPFFYRAV